METEVRTALFTGQIVTESLRNWNKLCLPQLNSRIRFNVQQQRGHIVGVYDGRKWPVDQCGSVYVTYEDTVQQLTNTIVTLNSTAGKNNQANKCTIAIGTTHGHVQAFLDDTDIVLSALNCCTAQEKCLMLIKRPKTKKMLKAHSWANLSMSETQQYRHLDGYWPTENKTDHKKHKFHWRKKERSSMSSMSSPTSVDPATSHVVSSPRDREENSFQEVISSRVFAPIYSEEVCLNNKNICPDITASHCGINNNYMHLQGEASFPGRLIRRPPVSQSCTDIPTLPIVSESDDDGRIGNDQLYSTVKVNRVSTSASGNDQVLRTHSLGDLTTGLTLSVVGQRRTDSMLNLSALHSSEKRNGDITPLEEAEDRSSQCVETNGNIAQGSIPEEIVPLAENDYLLQQRCTSNQGRISANSISSREKTPLKGKRSLPQVPVSEASERIKRFTELMKARMALHSSASHKTTSVVSLPVTPQQGENSDIGITQSNGELYKVFSPNSHPNRDIYCSTAQQFKSATVKERNCNEVRNKHSTGTVTFEMPQASQHWSTYSHYSTPQLPGYHSTDSTHNIPTVHSHISTLDSGYITNNDCDSEIYATLPQPVQHHERLEPNLSQTVRDIMVKNQYSSNRNHRTSCDHANTVCPPMTLESGNTHIDGTKHTGNQKDPQATTRIRGFCPVKEEENCERYNPPPRTAPKQCNKGNKWHYGSQSNFNFIPFQGKKFEKDALSRIHGNKAVAVRQFKVQAEASVSERYVHSAKKITENFLDSTSMNGSVAIKTGSLQSVSHHLPSSETPESQEDLNSVHYPTLPGNWKFKGQNSLDYKSCAGKFPTLFQLSQLYTFHGTKIVLSKSMLSESLKLTDKVIELPALKETVTQDFGTAWMPQGQYAQLGGPGSAFRPVRSSGLTSFTLVSIDNFQQDIITSCDTLNKGDLLIEMNGRLILGADSKLVQKTLEIIQGEIILTVARHKQETVNISVKMEHMMKEIDFLRAQIAQQDTHIKQLQTVIPCEQTVLQQTDQVIQHADIANEEVEISDDEFIV